MSNRLIFISLPAAVAVACAMGTGWFFMADSMGVSHAPTTLANIAQLVIGPAAAFIWLCSTADVVRVLRSYLWLLILLAYLFASWLYPLDTQPEFAMFCAIPAVVLATICIRQRDIRLIRGCIVALAVALVVFMIVWGRHHLSTITSGNLTGRFDAGVDPGAVLIPRATYFLAMTCFFTLLFDTRRWMKAIALPCLLLSLLLGFASGGRGGAVAFVASALVMVILIHSWRARFAWCLAILAVVSAGFMLSVALLPEAYERILTVSDPLRMQKYSSALENITILGNGIPKQYVHNVFLEFLHDYGLAGLLLFLLALGATVSATIRSYLSTRDSEIVWMMCALVYFLVVQQFSFNLYNSVCFWAALALPIAVHTDLLSRRAHGTLPIRDRHINIEQPSNDTTPVHVTGR